MDRYQKVEKPRPEMPISENEIRITSQGIFRSYVNYAANLLLQERQNEIVLKGMGQAINKTVAIAEKIKRRIPKLYQDTSISSMSITDVWEPIEEGLLPVEQTRQVSMISITLSTEDLNKDSPGYQPPALDQAKPNNQRQSDQARPQYNNQHQSEQGRPQHNNQHQYEQRRPRKNQYNSGQGRRQYNSNQYEQGSNQYNSEQGSNQYNSEQGRQGRNQYNNQYNSVQGRQGREQYNSNQYHYEQGRQEWDQYNKNLYHSEQGRPQYNHQHQQPPRQREMHDAGHEDSYGRGRGRGTGRGRGWNRGGYVNNQEDGGGYSNRGGRGSNHDGANYGYRGDGYGRGRGGGGRGGYGRGRGRNGPYPRGGGNQEVQE